jgi:hypothetical protein
VLTDNGIQFTTPGAGGSAVPLIKEAIANGEIFRAHAFELACARNDIEHRTTKPKHPWTNGQVERMNRTLKEARVKQNLDLCRAHRLAPAPPVPQPHGTGRPRQNPAHLPQNRYSLATQPHQPRQTSPAKTRPNTPFRAVRTGTFSMNPKYRTAVCEHMDVIPRQQPVNDRDAHFGADLLVDFTHPLANLAVKNLEAIFRNLDNVVTVMKNCVTSGAVSHSRYPPKK